MNGWMEGWMDGWMGGCVGGWMDGLAIGFVASQPRCTQVLIDWPFVPHTESWEPRNFAEVPNGHQV